jgi:type IV pilus assembly protein PilV
MTMRTHVASQRGYLMIEVLITMFILAVGLLGVVGLQARSQQAETDSYQRTQALVLLRDMAARINANHAQAFDTTTSPYLVPTTDPVGTGTANTTVSTTNCTGATAIATIDLCAWHSALLGATETYGGGNVGAMLNARGCITSPAAHTYLIQIVWQGLTPSAAPPASVACGATLYGTNDDLRRAVATVVQVGDINAP